MRSEERTYDLLPRSVAFEIVGGLKIQPDPDADPWLVMAGGYFLRITPTRFEFFITAAASTSIGLSGRAIGLFIVQILPRTDASGNDLDDNAIPGIAGLIALDITAGISPPGGDTLGISSIGSVFQFSGKVRVVFNSTLEEQVFQVPESFLSVLPAGYPTQITIFESAPNLAGDAEEMPASDGGAYLSALVEGSDHAVQRDHARRLHGLHAPDRRRPIGQLREGHGRGERQRRQFRLAVGLDLARLLPRHRRRRHERSHTGGGRPGDAEPAGGRRDTRRVAERPGARPVQHALRGGPVRHDQGQGRPDRRLHGQRRVRGDHPDRDRPGVDRERLQVRPHRLAHGRTAGDRRPHRRPGRTRRG